MKVSTAKIDLIPSRTTKTRVEQKRAARGDLLRLGHLIPVLDVVQLVRLALPAIIDERF